MAEKYISKITVGGVQHKVKDAEARQAVATAYQKPQTGIPKTDLASEVQSNLAAIDGIIDLIPEQASASNKLADKTFVNSSIATATATYRGAYNLVTDLSLTTSATHAEIATALSSVIATADNNDYCFVQIPTADDTPTEIARIERYKYNGSAWVFEYALNNSGFTAAQWAAVNSGITSGLVTKLSDLPTATELATLLAGKASTSELEEVAAAKQDKLVSGSNIKTINGTPVLGSGDIQTPIGTITGITMNSTSKGTSGVVNLGTVITGIKKGTTTLTPSSGAVTIPQSTSPTSGSTDFITSGGVYSALQSYEKKLTFTTPSTSSYTAAANYYYRHTNTVNGASITMPSSKSAGDMVVINFTAGSSPSVSIGGNGTTVKYHADYAITASKINEIVCVYNGQYWLVTNTVFGV